MKRYNIKIYNIAGSLICDDEITADSENDAITKWLEKNNLWDGAMLKIKDITRSLLKRV